MKYEKLSEYFKKKMGVVMIQKSEYEENIRLLCKCNSFIDDPEEYLNDTYFDNSEISAYFWDKGFDSAMRLADQFESEKIKLKKALDVSMEAIDNIDIVFADDVEIIRQAKQKIKQILKGESDEK